VSSYTRTCQRPKPGQANPGKGTFTGSPNIFCLKSPTQYAYNYLERAVATAAVVDTVEIASRQVRNSIGAAVPLLFNGEFGGGNASFNRVDFSANAEYDVILAGFAGEVVGVAISGGNAANGGNEMPKDIRVYAMRGGPPEEVGLLRYLTPHGLNHSDAPLTQHLFFAEPVRGATRLRLRFESSWGNPTIVVRQIGAVVPRVDGPLGIENTTNSSLIIGTPFTRPDLGRFEAHGFVAWGTAMDLSVKYKIKHSPYECLNNLTLCPECQNRTDTLCRDGLATLDNRADAPWASNYSLLSNKTSKLLEGCISMGKNICPMSCSATAAFVNGTDGLNQFNNDGSPTSPRSVNYPAFCTACDLSEDGISFCAATGRCKCLPGYYGEGCETFIVPTGAPTTGAPTDSPTTSPTDSPTTSPTTSPTKAPTPPGYTYAPTASPTKLPTKNPTKTPTSNPTRSPTPPPTPLATDAPTTSPTQTPTAAPTNITHKTDVWMSLSGYSEASFGATERTALKSAVAGHTTTNTPLTVSNNDIVIYRVWDLDTYNASEVRVRRQAHDGRIRVEFYISTFSVVAANTLSDSMATIQSDPVAQANFVTSLVNSGMTDVGSIEVSSLSVFGAAAPNPSPAPTLAPTMAPRYTGVENSNAPEWWWIAVGVGCILLFCGFSLMCYQEQYGEDHEPRILDCCNAGDGHSFWYKLCYFIWYYAFFGCCFHKAFQRGKSYNPRRTNPEGDCWYNIWFCVWYTCMCGICCNQAPNEKDEDSEDNFDGTEAYSKNSAYARRGAQPGVHIEM